MSALPSGGGSGGPIGHAVGTPVWIAELATDPAAVANQIALYSVTASPGQLFARLENGTILDLTASGGTAPADAPYLTDGAVTDLSAEVNVRVLTATLNFGASIPATNQLSIVPTAPLAVVVNESGSDCDFRVEGDTLATTIVSDAGLDSVAFGSAAVSGVRMEIGFPASTSGSPTIVRVTAGAHTADPSGIN